MIHCEILVTHANCPDGLATAMIARSWNAGLPVTFATHDELRTLPTQPGMVFCDIAPPRERAREFVEAGAWVLDHHLHQKDVVELFGARGVYADQPGVSGALLALEHLTPEPSTPLTRSSQVHNRLFAELVGVRDTWQQDDPRWVEACELQATLMHMPRDYWQLAVRGTPPIVNALQLAKSIGPMLRGSRLDAVERVVRQGLVDMGELMPGKRFGCFPDPQNLISDVADAAEGYDVIVGFQPFVRTGSRKTKVGLRSRTGVDVGALATLNGGGGHEAAAGYWHDDWMARIKLPDGREKDLDPVVGLNREAPEPVTAAAAGHPRASFLDARLRLVHDLAAQGATDETIRQQLSMDLLQVQLLRLTDCVDPIPASDRDLLNRRAGTTEVVDNPIPDPVLP